MLKNTQNEYGSVAKFFHWLVFLLVLCMLIAGYFMGDIGDKPLRGEVINLHKLTGLTILLLMLLRAGWSLMNPKPDLPIGTPVWERYAERLVHFLLYALLIVMPFSGWIMSVAAGHTPHLGDLMFSLPVPENKALSNFAYDVHYWIAIAIISVVSLHILAALYHHYIKHDNVLKRMWPWHIK